MAIADYASARANSAAMSRSTVARSLEPLAASLWGFFLVWTALLAVVWIGAVDEFFLKANVGNDGLLVALVALVNSATPAWLALGVANMHLAIARAEGLATARRWLGILLGASLALGSAISSPAPNAPTSRPCCRG